MNAHGSYAVVLLLTVAGCASSVAPKELIDARGAYSRASQGATASANPADLHTAKEQLDVAEASFKDEGDTQDTRDASYLAMRRTELAEVVGRTRLTNQTREGGVDAMHTDQKNTVALTSAALGRSKEQNATQAVALADAEKRAAQAAADLAKFATVKRESRGMVIALSGSVLFASAKSDLLPAARARLDGVATALVREDPRSHMVVEGHTDSQGTAASNQDLSQRRAQSVRDYLVTRGIASDRITAQGFGPTRSIADNSSPEGRANNRRVEIVGLPSP